jgi:hypothetical protein
MYFAVNQTFETILRDDCPQDSPTAKRGAGYGEPEFLLSFRIRNPPEKKERIANPL